MSVLAGLSAFPVTPADPDGHVQVDHLQQLVARLARPGIASIGVLGSTGSYAYLNRTERSRALQAAVQAAGDTPVLAGVGALRTSDVLAHALDAEQAGAGALLLAPMSYLPLSDDEVFTLTADLAAAVDLPICFYNNPGTTHFTLSEDLLLRLGEIDGVKAVKNPAPADMDFAGQLARLRPALPDGFALGYSGDATIAGALGAGCDLWCSVLAGTMPDICIALWDARNDPVSLAALNDQLAPVWALFAKYGSIRIVHEMTQMMGLGQVTPPRPLLPLSDTARADIITAFDQANLALNETT